MHMLVRNVFATTASFIGATIWTKFLSRLVHMNKLAPRNARKVMHISTAPLFMLTWPLYSNNTKAAFMAACVPLSFAIKILKNPKADTLVRSVAREKNNHIDQHTNITERNSDQHVQRQASGPIAYGLSVAVITALSWRGNWETYLSLAALCFGDGFADVAGNYFRGKPIPFLPNRLFWKKKTIQGSMGCFFATAVGGFAMLRMAQFGGYVSREALKWGTIVGTATVATIVEVLPYEDNLTVPLAVYFVNKGLKM